MGIKTSARLLLEKIIGKFGYTMVRNHELEKYRVVIDERIVPFCNEDFQNRKKNQYTVSWIMPPPGKGSGGHMTLFRTIGILSIWGCIIRFIFAMADREILLWTGAER